MPRKKRTSAQVDEDMRRLVERARAAIFAGQPPIAIYNAGYIPREIAAVLAAEEEAYLEAEARGITFIRRVSKHRRNKGASATAPPPETELQPEPAPEPAPAPKPEPAPAPKPELAPAPQPQSAPEPKPERRPFKPSYPPVSTDLTEAERVRQEAYALRAEAAEDANLLRAEAKKALEAARRRLSELENQSPEQKALIEARADVCAARDEANALRDAAREECQQMRSAALAFKAAAEADAAALRAEAAYLYELLRRQVDFAGLDDTITQAAIARRKRQKLTEEETTFMLSSGDRLGQAANDFTVQWRPPERGGILSRSEVAVLLSILDKHLKSNYNPQAGALEVHFVDKAGSSTQAIRIYLAEGAGTVIHLNMMGADAIVMSSIDGILTSWRKNTPPKLPDSVKIIYNNIGRYAVLPVRSGCFLVSYAASYTAEQAQTAVRFAMATVIATLAHFAVTHGERGQPLSSARCGSVDGAMIRVENAFLRLGEPELRNWQHWHETAKPTAWQIPNRGKK